MILLIFQIHSANPCTYLFKLSQGFWHGRLGFKFGFWNKFIHVLQVAYTNNKWPLISLFYLYPRILSGCHCQCCFTSLRLRYFQLQLMLIQDINENDDTTILLRDKVLLSLLKLRLPYQNGINFEIMWKSF